MPVLTPAQMAAYDRAAGFSTVGPDLITMVAIQMSESGGNTDAHNTNASTGDDSYGISQINMIGNLGPARLKQFGITSATQLFDPAINAKAAYTLFKSGGFSPWSTYKTGAYRKNLAVASAAVNSLPSTSSGLTSFISGIPGESSLAGAIRGIGNAASSTVNGIPNAITGFSNTLFNGITDVAGVLVAIVLLITGFLILGRNHVKPVLKAGSKIAEVAAL